MPRVYCDRGYRFEMASFRKPTSGATVLKVLEQARVEAWAGGELSRILAPAEELAELQVLGRRMIRREAARDPLQPLALERADDAFERGRFDDGPELPEVGGDVLADGLQLGGVGRVEAAADPDPLRRDLEVQAGRPGASAGACSGNTAEMCVLSGVLSSENRVSR